MGREVKRVPMEFDWPMRVTWLGYRNPYYMHRSDCRACQGTGYSVTARKYKNQWYGQEPFDPGAYGVPMLSVDDPAVLRQAERNVDNSPEFYQVTTRGRDHAVKDEAYRLWRDCFAFHWSHNLNQADVDALVAHGRLYDFTHHWSQERGWQPIEPPPVVLAADVNRWSLDGLGHDSINCYVCIRARCEREGEPVSCSECDGDGEHWPTQAHKMLYEAWSNINPPSGDGWQMWETTSEGSPISPVFSTPEELAQWLADTDASAFGNETATYDQWLAMIRREWAPSCVTVNGKPMSGVEASSL